MVLEFPILRKENVCVILPTTLPEASPQNDTIATDAKAITNSESKQQDNEKDALAVLKSKGTCCFLMKYGVCNPRNPPCRFYHPPEGEVIDDGVSPCAFGLACRQGHAKRCKIKFQNKQQKEEFWNKYYGYDSGESPAVRDANLLQSQLEPWPTSNLRQRLVNDFGESYKEMDLLDRKALMDKLLQHYEDRANPLINTNMLLPARKNVCVRGGTPIPESMQMALLEELESWRKKHGKINTRPSIKAISYLILRAPTEWEIEQKKLGLLSRRAAKALSKIEKHRSLWDLATQAIELVRPHDPQFLDSFSALAVTYGFSGSPHIDKQNTGPFYGLSLGEFTGPVNGGGCVCVEADAFTVAHVSTHNSLNKCDGRYPHWVGDYEGERYSLIYYATSTDKHKYMAPGQAYFGSVVGEEK